MERSIAFHRRRRIHQARSNSSCGARSSISPFVGDGRARSARTARGSQAARQRQQGLLLMRQKGARWAEGVLEETWMIRSTRFNRSIARKRNRLPSRISSNEVRDPSEVSVNTHGPAKCVEDTGNEDAPLPMTEGGIKPKRLGHQTDDESPPTPAAEQHCSHGPDEYRGLGGKFQPCSFCRRRCLRGGHVFRPRSKQSTELQAAPPK